MSMEKRTLLAIVLMAAFLVLYQYLLLPPEPLPVAPTVEETAEDAAPEVAGRPAPGTAPPRTWAPPPIPSTVLPGRAAPAPPRPVVRPPQRLVTIESPLYHAVVSSEGGKIQELTLHYRGEKPMVQTGELGPLGLLVATEPGRPAAPVPMQVLVHGLMLGRERPRGDVVLLGEEGGIRIRQTLQFHADNYAIDLRISLENLTDRTQTVSLSLPWISRQAWRESKEAFAGQHPTEIVFAVDGRVDRLEDLCAVQTFTTGGSWIGAGSIWYLAALVPRTPDFQIAAAAEPQGCAEVGKEPVGRTTVMVQAAPSIPPGQIWDGHVVMYVGPKEYDRLKAHGLEPTINFGGFPVPRKYGGLPMEWVGLPIMWLMNWVYRYVGNYGIAIIVLTVLTKVLFFPLTIKSMRSMKAMQALQPQINALRSKHKSDPQRLQRETLELYRKHKVNPLGGCLPMLAQVPVFYALYLALSVSVELQNAAFLCFGRLFGVDLWICDLASHDPTYVLPILMGVTMFVQQKMTPVPDPRQAKMMLFMPIVFTFMFFTLPSGLVLYWTVSNALQIAQQYYMDRPRPERPAREPAKDASSA